MSPTEGRLASAVNFSINEVDFSTNFNSLIAELKQLSPNGVIYICGTPISGDCEFVKQTLNKQRCLVKELRESVELPIFSWSDASTEKLADLITQNGENGDKLAFYRNWVLTSGGVAKVIAFEGDNSPVTDLEIEIAKNWGVGILDFRKPKT